MLLPLQDTALLEYERRVSAARTASRMQRTQARKEQVEEERRAAILAAEAAAERRLQQKHEVRVPCRCCSAHCKFAAAHVCTLNASGWQCLQGWQFANIISTGPARLVQLAPLPPNGTSVFLAVWH